jgi:hypothetical protein
MGKMENPLTKPILICSVAPETFKIKRSYNWNGLTIPPCAPEKPYTSLLVEDHMDEKVSAIDHWAEHSIHTPFPIEAQVIVADFFANEKLKQKGCFIPAGEIPTEKEIATARDTRRAYLLDCVNKGDGEYSRTGRIDDISGEWKRAASELGMNVEWAKMAPPPKPAMFDCPVCGENLKVGVAVCKSCGVVLDKEKLAAYTFACGEPAKKEKEPKVI